MYDRHFYKIEKERWDRVRVFFATMDWAMES